MDALGIFHRYARVVVGMHHQPGHFQTVARHIQARRGYASLTLDQADEMRASQGRQTDETSEQAQLFENPRRRRDRHQRFAAQPHLGRQQRRRATQGMTDHRTQRRRNSPAASSKAWANSTTFASLPGERPWAGASRAYTE